MTDNSHTHQKITLLLVEDHNLTRIGLKTILARTDDIQVIAEAANGQEAVKLALELKPKIILMDVGMPIMDGIEATKLIREKNPDINVIMLTSHDNDRDIFASLSAGAAGYCLKDVAPDRLYAAIRSVNAGDVWLDSAIANKVIHKYSASKPSDLSSTNKTDGKLETATMVEPLSARELEVLNLVVEGLSNQQIADKLIISLATAKTHVRNILNKLAVDDRTQAAVTAMRKGLV